MNHQPSDSNLAATHGQLEWLATVSTAHASESHHIQRGDDGTWQDSDVLEFLAAILGCDRTIKEDTSLCGAELCLFVDSIAVRRTDDVHEGEWDPSKHPRRGGPPNAGWFSSSSGNASPGTSATGSDGGEPSLFDNVVRRNRDVADLTGITTPAMRRSNRLAIDLQTAQELRDQVPRAAMSGLRTGGKAVVNGSATAIKNTATLGLSTSQLELIGVTKEDRDNGYDKAVAIATGSGEVLIAVGTGGLASALSKGGAVARSGSGVLIAYDATGNAVGVIQGTYDAAKNGVSVRNGIQIAAGAVGLGANLRTARGIKWTNPLPKGFDPLKGFASFDDFKEAFGDAGPGHAWHHIVEQTINSGKFAAELAP